MFEATDKMKAIFRTKYIPGDNKSLQDAIILLKHSGYSQMECLRLLMEELELNLSEADNIILNSEAWVTEKDANKNIRNGLGKVE